MIQGARITIPEQPARVDWLDQDQPQMPGINYLDPPQLIKPGQTCTPGKDGSVLVTPRAWQGIRYGLREWPRWGDTIESIVKRHNEIVSDESQNRSLWQRLWGK